MDEQIVYNGIINMPMLISQSSETFKHLTSLGLEMFITKTACQSSLDISPAGVFICTRSPHPGDPLHIACGELLVAFWLEQK